MIPNTTELYDILKIHERVLSDHEAKIAKLEKQVERVRELASSPTKGAIYAARQKLKSEGA